MIVRAPKFKIGLYDPDHATFSGDLSFWLKIAVINLSTKFKVLNSTSYQDIKSDTKCKK